MKYFAPLATLGLMLALSVVTGDSLAQSPTPFGAGYSPVTTFDPQRDAAKDIADALREAKRSDRRVLLDVGGEWCIWCHRLDTLFMRHPALAEYLHSNYVVVKVNYSKENKNEAVLSRYPKIPGYPHLFVLAKDGALLHSQDTGELESGKGHDPAKIRTFLEAWSPSGTGSGGKKER